MFSACGDDGCQRTCERLDVTGCTRQCTVSGCICTPGFVRNNLGVCVSPFMCRKLPSNDFILKMLDQEE